MTIWIKNQALGKISRVINMESSFYARQVSKETGINYPYVNELFHKLEKKGFLTGKKEGRIRKLYKTAKGDKYFQLLYLITTLEKNV